MNQKNRYEQYLEFVEFVRMDSQSERRAVNRRMWQVLLWCFLAPAAVSIVLIFFVRVGILPRTAIRYFDWLLVGFPIAYSLYVLSFEVLSEIPVAIRRGSIATTLRNSLRDAEWRHRVCEELKRQALFKNADWSWIVASFRLDLQNIHQRTRYMTALSGAVFFLILQGLDALDDIQPLEDSVARTGFLGWIEASSNNVSQFVGLGIFLVLLYVSGSQTHHSLARYLDCAELMLLESKKED